MVNHELDGVICFACLFSFAGFTLGKKILRDTDKTRIRGRYIKVPVSSQIVSNNANAESLLP